MFFDPHDYDPEDLWDCEPPLTEDEILEMESYEEQERRELSEHGPA